MSPPIEGPTGDAADAPGPSGGTSGPSGPGTNVSVDTRPASGAGPAEGPIPERPLGLWEGYGVEIEMMIVDGETLDVRPVADRLFERVGGDPSADVEVEGIGWSNELALHVLELKTPGPVSTLEALAGRFQRSVERASEALGELGCRLLPGGVHPWMDPVSEFRIWPHEYTEIYRTFDRIFSCRGHGWANLQSTHLNLSFRNDGEFALLHEAIRVVLPLIPALAAASPVLDGRAGPALDNRLLEYRRNARRVPSVTGMVVPEDVRSEAGYREVILERIYRDMEALDPGRVLRHEWVNARGAIARFERGSIEVRIIDAQESPTADVAVAAAVAAAVRRAAEVLEADTRDRGSVTTGRLADLLDRTVRVGRRASVEGVDYRRLLDLPRDPADAGDAWRILLDEAGLLGEASEFSTPLRSILEEGSLAERILADLGLQHRAEEVTPVSKERLRATWQRMADTLADGGLFRA